MEKDETVFHETTKYSDEREIEFWTDKHSYELLLNPDKCCSLNIKKWDIKQNDNYAWEDNIRTWDYKGIYEITKKTPNQTHIKLNFDKDGEFFLIQRCGKIGFTETSLPLFFPIYTLKRKLKFLKNLE